MFGIFLDTTARDPYLTPDLYQRSFDRYYDGIERYLLQLDVSKWQKYYTRLYG